MILFFITIENDVVYNLTVNKNVISVINVIIECDSTLCRDDTKTKWQPYSSHTLQFRELSPLDRYKALTNVHESFSGDARSNKPNNMRKERK